MRDIVFKNLTSSQRKRKVLSTSEVMEHDGILTKIRRNFIYIVRDGEQAKKEALLPRMYVFKHKDSSEHKEKFFCRIKGSLYTMNNNKLFFVIFSHSLSIGLEPTLPKNPH